LNLRPSGYERRWIAAPVLIIGRIRLILVGADLRPSVAVGAIRVDKPLTRVRSTEPCKPISAINRSTVHRATRTPSLFNRSHTLSAP